MSTRIYFDISATTPLNPEIGQFINDLNKRVFGNPSSIHREGQAAKAVIEKSRIQISKALNVKPEEIIFTSSGSESNNMVVKGILNPGDHFITSSYEHPAILNIIPFLEQNNINTTLLNPNKKGLIDPEEVNRSIRDNTRLISIIWVHNELGTINPINEIGNLAKKHNILFHSDAVQAFGKVNLNMQNTSIDFISMSGHKLYGPKGVGAIYKRSGVKLSPLIHGGGQEHNLRASTENIAGIGGFGLASEMASINLENNIKHIIKLESCFIDELNKHNIPYSINGENRVPGVLNITFFDMSGQDLVLQLDFSGIGISSGSACTSGTVKASKMLKDIGLSEKDALSTVRISFGKIHSEEQIKLVVEEIDKILMNNKIGSKKNG